MSTPLPSARQLLASFLRERRARLQPHDVGLPEGSRRRTRGLRREEVAQLAGIGLTWYTWLEQAREINVSGAFLDSLATALRLDESARSYLHTLASGGAVPPAADEPRVHSSLQLVLDALPWPAHVMNTRWDVLAWNAATTALFGDYAALPPAHRNTVRRVFLDPAFRDLLVDWENDARLVVARFRLDAGSAIDDPRLTTLIDELLQHSSEFAAWWPQQDVLGRRHGHKRLRRPNGEIATYAYTALAVEGEPGLRMAVYTPA